MGRKLLIDNSATGLRMDALSEASGERYVFTGKFAQADVPTHNNRIYPRKLWEREIKRLRGKVLENKVFGELDHPEDGKTKLQRTAVLIKDLNIDEQGQVIGTFKVLETSMGKELKAIADGGGAIGVSSRGYGSIRMNEDGHAVVQDDFTLLTFDPVADPAEETAYPTLEKISDDKPEVEPVEAEPSKPSEAWLESISRDKLNSAIKKAKSVYVEAIKNVSHKDALDRAVSEGYKLTSNQYDLKDFAIEVAAEVMSVPKDKPIKEDVSEPMRLELETVIKSQIQESINQILSEKDSALNSVKDALSEEKKNVERLKAELSESQKTISDFVDVTKELGYSLFLQQHLGKHPKLKQIKESLGDLSKIESLDDLQNKVKVHISEVSKIMEAEDSKTKFLNEKVSGLDQKISLLEQELDTKSRELQEALDIGLKSAAAVYLERRIVSNPFAPEIRKRFAEMSEKTKGSVDNLLSEYRGRRINENSDFHGLRKRLDRQKKVDENLVESHIKETMPIDAEKLSIHGESFDVSYIKRLAGV